MHNNNSYQNKQQSETHLLQFLVGHPNVQRSLVELKVRETLFHGIRDLELHVDHRKHGDEEDGFDHGSLQDRLCHLTDAVGFIVHVLVGGMSKLIEQALVKGRDLSGR